MTTDINLYKINDLKGFKKELHNKKYVGKSINKDKLSKDETNNLNNIDLTLYYFKESDSAINWSWILNKFDITVNTIKSKPKAILLIKKFETFYAISFGYSYHLVGKYANTDWPLEFAERMDFNSIKSVGIFAPNSRINKKIYNYFNYNNLDADIGEAFTKISATLDLDESTLKYLSSFIVIGNSLKFKIKIYNLESILNLINYVELIMLREIKNKLPKLKECKDKSKIEKLNDKLVKKIKENIETDSNEISINIAEFTIIGYNYVFFNEYYENFIFELNNKKDYYTELNSENIYNFIKKNMLEYSENLLDMNISMFSRDNEFKCILKDLIMFSDDENIFNEGIWYEYNSLFLDYIHDYLEDINVFHLEEYDFNDKEEYGKIINEMRSNSDLGKADYFEYNFNNYVQYDNDKFFCLDRKKYYFNGLEFEFGDLIDQNNKIIYSVKVGKNASELSYVIDQSLMGLKALDDGEVEDFKKSDIEGVGLWLIFKRNKNFFKIEDNKLNWEEMNYLIIKSKIAEWKKQVLLSGRKPVININYRYVK